MTINNVKRVVSPDDLARLQFVLDAQLSPDAGRLVYLVASVDEGGRDRTTMWLMDLASGIARRFAEGTGGDMEPRWSPDGRRIAFLSDRSGSVQLHVADADGDVARALTHLPQGVAGRPDWSPDGTQIAFVASPSLPSRHGACPQRRVTHRVYRCETLGYEMNHEVHVVPAGGGDPTRITQDNQLNVNPVWSPCGHELLVLTICSDPDPDLLKLRVVDLDGGQRDLLRGWGVASTAAWDPSGERVVFVGAPAGVRQPGLWVVDRRGGTPECRTEGIDLWVGRGVQPDMPLWPAAGVSPGGRVCVSPDGRGAYVEIQCGGKVPIYRIALSGPQSWEALGACEHSCVLMDARAGRLAYVLSTLDSPSELHTLSLPDRVERQHTRLNEPLLSTRALPTVRRLRFASHDGVEVEGWALIPSQGAPPYPTVVFSHAGPRWAFGHMFLFDAQMLAGAGYAVLLLNPRGSSGYGDAFGARTFDASGEPYWRDLMAGVDHAITLGIADPDRLGCYGLSMGGFMTCYLVGRTNRFRAAVAENPITNWWSFYGTSGMGPWFCLEELGGPPHQAMDRYLAGSPITRAHLCTTPTLLIQGEADLTCPPEQSEQFYATLKANGCVAEMLKVAEMGHCGSAAGPIPVRNAQNAALLGWMNRFLAPGGG